MIKWPVSIDEDDPDGVVDCESVPVLTDDLVSTANAMHERIEKWEQWARHKHADLLMTVNRTAEQENTLHNLEELLNQ